MYVQDYVLEWILQLWVGKVYFFFGGEKVDVLLVIELMFIYLEVYICWEEGCWKIYCVWDVDRGYEQLIYDVGVIIQVEVWLVKVVLEYKKY